MQTAQDVLFKTLADPTRRAIFERLCRTGEKASRQEGRNDQDRRQETGSEKAGSKEGCRQESRQRLISALWPR